MYDNLEIPLTVNQLARMVHDPLNQLLLFQMSDRNPCQTTIDFESLDKNTLADEFECGHFFEDTVVCGLIKGDGVLCFVFYFSLGPLLFLGGFAAGGWRWGFSFGLRERKCQHCDLRYPGVGDAIQPLWNHVRQPAKIDDA